MVFRGVILELDDKMALIIDNEGRYLKVRQTSEMEIGAFVEFGQNDILEGTNEGKYEIIRHYGKFLYALASMVAVFAVVFSVLFLMNRDSVNSTFAYVDIDINPSMELKINQDGFITGIEPLNKDAEKVAEKINFMGQKIENGVEAIIKRSSEMGYFKNEKKLVLVAASINIKDRIPVDRYEKMNSQLAELVDSIETQIDTSYKDVELIAFNTSPVKMKQAKENHMSIGRYSLYKNACNDGIKLALEDAKDLKIFELLNLLPSKDYTDFAEKEKKSAIDEEFIKITPKESGKNNKSGGNRTESSESDAIQSSKPTPSQIIASGSVPYNTPAPGKHNNENSGDRDDEKTKGNDDYGTASPEEKSSVKPVITPADDSPATPAITDIIKPSQSNNENNNGNGNGKGNNNGKGNSTEPTLIVEQTPGPILSSPTPDASQNPSLNPGKGTKSDVTPPGLIKKDSTPKAVASDSGNNGNGKGNGKSRSSKE